MRPDALVHTPAGYGVVERTEIDEDGCELVTVLLEAPHGTEDYERRKFRRDECEPAWWELLADG